MKNCRLQFDDYKIKLKRLSQIKIFVKDNENMFFHLDSELYLF